jgi:hypothetical protein
MNHQKTRNIMHSNFNHITHTWQGRENGMNLYGKSQVPMFLAEIFFPQATDN